MDYKNIFDLTTMNGSFIVRLRAVTNRFYVPLTFNITSKVHTLEYETMSAIARAVERVS